MSGDLRWGELLMRGAKLLSEHGVERPAQDARLLLAGVLGVSRGDVLAIDDRIAELSEADAFLAAVKRRADGEPVSRIRGEREFYGRTFAVTPDVLDPRPDTELLVELGLEKLPPGGRVLDLGTGSGCILVSILAERPDARGVGVDLSRAALEVARRNAERHGVGPRAELVNGSWDAAAGVFDVVVSNPPYIPSGDIGGLAVEVRAHDPALALDGGPDGLSAVRDILKTAREALGADGWLAMEVGFDQTEAVMDLAAKAGWADVGRARDMAGHQRVVICRRGPE